METIMTKTEYIEALKKQLRRLPKDDLQRALDYFEEYFADAGPEHEAQAIEDLGEPSVAADQIITTMALANSREPVKNVKKGVNAVRVGTLALFAIPIGLPLLLVVIAVILILLLAVFILLFAGLLAGVFLTATGPLCIIVSLTQLAADFPVFLCLIGMGLAFLGLGILIIYGMIVLTKRTLSGCARMFGRLIEKGGKAHD